MCRVFVGEMGGRLREEMTRVALASSWAAPPLFQKDFFLSSNTALSSVAPRMAENSSRRMQQVRQLTTQTPTRVTFQSQDPEPSNRM
jgi:hypothetical protein